MFVDSTVKSTSHVSSVLPFAVLLDLTQGRVDVFDDEFLDIESLDDFANHRDSVVRDDFHSESRAWSEIVVFAMQREGLVEVQGTHRNPTDESIVSNKLDDLVVHDEWNATQLESPACLIPGRLLALFVLASVTRRSDLAENPFVPGSAFGRVREGTPNASNGRADRH